MPINSIQSQGDDQRWKAEVEKELADLKRSLGILRAQVDARRQ